ncbi:MmcQ/YjbR family DNA-binding protein [Agromyces sp. NPDC127015]|uniref:MmcQ/YjbR family DNA-binding protein n=1 Tax=Agromyces sp. NPDC127015 TaxID=3347108 RepID=UPI003667B57A
MADWELLRRLALALPDTSEAVSWGSAHWRVRGKGFVWERPLRKTDLAHLGLDEQPGPIMGARVEDEHEKLGLIDEDPDVFFTIPHFDGWPAILARLDRIGDERLAELVEEAWLVMAPPKLARARLDGRSVE